MPKPVDGKPSAGSLITEQGDFVVMSLEKVIEGDAGTLAENEAKMISNILAKQTGGQDLGEFVSGVRADADIEKF
jgi:hypothetical protein